MALLHRPPIAPLTEFVTKLREARPEATIPYFDPTEAGVNARILAFLEAPGRRAALEHGSGFVSADNDDQTAQNMWQLLREAEIDRARDYTAWNVVPWYIGDGTKIRPARADDLSEAREATRELLELLNELRVVVVLGRPAAKAWATLDFDLPAIEAPHPSPLSLNTRPERRTALLGALRQAAAQACA